MDVLSEVLSAVRLTSAFYFEVRAREPWATLTPAMTNIGHVVMPQAEHVIPFHVMMEGSAWAWPEELGLEPGHLEAGDVIMMSHGHSHLMASSDTLPQVPTVDTRVYQEAAASKAPYTSVSIGGAGTPARFVCGYLGCDVRPFNPLLSALPEMMVIKPGDQGRALLQTLIQAALGEEENTMAGSGTILTKLSELMVVQALRLYIDKLPAGQTGWLAGLRDPQVGAVLWQIHNHPAEPWTLQSLAEAAGMSRSKLAERFAVYTGQPPMQYLTRWRMQLAARRLEAHGASLGQVAEAVGYASEAAFQRAFKKHVGETPGAWRRGRTGGAAAKHRSGFDGSKGNDPGFAGPNTGH